MAHFETVVTHEEVPLFNDSIWRFIALMSDRDTPVTVVHSYPVSNGVRRVIEADSEKALAEFAHDWREISSGAKPR